MFQNHLRLFSREFFGSAASARRSDRESLVLRNPELPYVCCQKLHEPTPLPACGHPLPALRGEGRERGADLVHGFDSCEKRKEALHEPPPHPFPLPIRWGEGGREVG